MFAPRLSEEALSFLIFQTIRLPGDFSSLRVLERLVFEVYSAFLCFTIRGNNTPAFYIFENVFIYCLFKAQDLSFAASFGFSNELALKAWLMSLQKLGDCGSRGAGVAPRVGMVSERVAACASLPSPPDLAALDRPRRPPGVPWRSVPVGILFLWESLPGSLLSQRPPENDQSELGSDS